MKKILVIGLILLMAGCTIRMAAYAPHRVDNEDHRQATTNQDCLGCHDIVGKKGHQADDNCMRCHRIVKGV